MTKRFLALDLGTTTLAGALLTPQGEVAAQAFLPNPQVREGKDVMTRLQAAVAGRGEELRRLLAAGVNELTARLLERTGMAPETIVAAAAAGNPVVAALLAAREVKSLLFPPHRLSWRAGEELDSRGLGLDLSVPFYLFPLVGGFVGGDLVAFLYGAEKGPAPALYVDIGTNAEIALDTGDRWWVTSAAAGPAFEGGHISSGMAAVTGAIEGVSLVGDRLRPRVIGGGPARGLCGSGLIEAIAAGLAGGLIDPQGVLRSAAQIPDNLSRYSIERDKERCLLLYRDADGEVLLTQADIRQFQLAKGAVRAGIEALLERAGLSAGELHRVLVSGAFGLAIARETLKKVAMLPGRVVDRIVFVPHGVLNGVGRFLTRKGGKEEVARLAASLNLYPLSGSPVFERAFLQALDFVSPGIERR
ncbi:MAG: ATP-binding protein [Deltaproteobacteria bacterium]|nr:ATP-binding protein [Deltaproteobacteria bacterium]